MNKKMIWRILYILLILAMLATEVLAMTAVVRLNMLPGGYLAALITLFAVLSIAVVYLLFWKDSPRRKVAAFVLIVLLICGSVAIRTVANDVLHTLEATTQEDVNTTIRSVYVLMDNPAEELQDTVGYTYGYVNDYDEGATQQVLEEVNLQTNRQVIVAGFDNPMLMVNALLEERIDAIILNSGYTTILEEMDGFQHFAEAVRVLANIEVQESAEQKPEVKDPVDEDKPTEPTQAVVDVPEQEENETVDYSTLEPFVVYLSGSDSYDDEVVQNGRSDVNILVIVNPMTKQILLLNTPRDYYVQNTAGGWQRDKLTHCGMYGIGCSMDTLGELYNVDIEHYVRINFSGFKKMIDAIGGVTVYSDYAFTAIERTYIEEGENHLDGQSALDFARERYTLPGGDNERGRHQMQVITAVIEKATSGTTIISNYSEIMSSVEGMFTMNVPMEMISNLMKMQLNDMARWNINSYAVTGADAMEECYSWPGMELSVIIPYDSSVAKAERLIDMVFAGEILTEEVINSID